MQRQVREFDLDAKAFVAEREGGFALPEAKSRLCYKVETTRDQRQTIRDQRETIRDQREGAGGVSPRRNTVTKCCDQDRDTLLVGGVFGDDGLTHGPARPLCPLTTGG